MLTACGAQPNESAPQEPGLHQAPDEESPQTDSDVSETQTLDTLCEGHFFITDDDADALKDELEYLAYLEEGVNIVYRQISFEELEGCSEVIGNLAIVGTEDLNDLSRLAALRRIMGTFSLYGNRTLRSLNGLQSLREVQNNFKLGYCSGSSTLLPCWGNAELETLSGLESLETIGRSLTIAGNPKLTNLHPLANLSEIGMTIVSIRENTMLENLDGLDGLESISLTLRDNPSLDNINALSGITESPHGLWIEGNPNLRELKGLEDLTHANNRVWVIANQSLLNLDALESLETIRYGALRIVANDSLEDLEGLSSLRSVDGDVIVSNSPNLTSVNGISNLSEINGNLQITHNERLESFEGAQNLYELGGDLAIWGNTRLTYIAGFDNLERLNGSFRLGMNEFGQTYSNPSLETITAFQSLGQIGENFHIIGYQILSTLEFLPVLNQIAGDAWIFGNAGLSTCSINAFLDRVGAESIGGELRVDNDQDTTPCEQ